MTKKFVSALLSIVLVGAALSAYFATRPNADTYDITADVAQAPNLFDGGRVMVRGVEVGEITDVEPTPDGVRLTLTLRSEYDVPADARLSVVPITVISDRYVQLFPAYRRGDTMQDGDHIPLEHTSIPAELDEVLAQLKGLLAALEPRGEKNGPLAGLIRNLDRAVAGRSEELAATVEGSAAVLQNLAASDAEITALIRNLDRLFVALASRSSQLGLVNERFELVAEALLTDQANLEGTIENLAFLSEEAGSLVSESGDQLGESFDRLATVLDAVLRHQDDIRIGVRWANAIAQALGETDASGRGLYAYSGRQAGPGSERAKYNYRIDRRDTLTCERINETAETVFAVTPQATPDDIVTTVLSYIPDPYDDDLEFIIRRLVLACVDEFAEQRVQSHAATAVRQAARAAGRDEFGELLREWLFGTSEEGP